MIRFVLCALMTLVLVGCQSQSKQQSSAALPEFRYLNYQVYDPVYIGIDQGFFDKHGVHVTIMGDVLGGPNAIQAVSGGSADGALAAVPALINARAAGIDVVGVTDMQSALPGQPLEEYFVRTDSPLHSMADLASQPTKPKIAINNAKASFHYTALLGMQQNGVPDDAVDFVLMGFDQQGTALLSKSVDVIGLITPYNTRLKATNGGDVRVLTDANQIFGTEQFTLNFVSGSYAREHPTETKAFVAGIRDAAAWTEDHQSEAAAIVGKYTGIDAQYVPTYHFQPDAKVDDDSTKFWIDFLHNRGDLTADVKPSDVATNAYNEAVH